jgi:hypothetical protein
LIKKNLLSRKVKSMIDNLLNYSRLDELTKDLDKEKLLFIAEFWLKSNEILDDWRSISLNIGNLI